ncbi:sensor histidine kinase [Haloimpatiens lingqiaonensis]|uniref:sensor histidine kinase n=1 Tax=Haloimpatiens lingqiaonensis TaxID=1380675 RepID=UPI0010FE6411|nr:HAMP domain-containing sensor histidine kinase [Haloimpatiens lingqiaonensis]
MKKGLFSKMVATYTIIIAISFTILATVLSLWFENYYFEQNKNELAEKAALIGDSAVQYMYGDISYYEMNKQLKLIGDYLKVDIWLTDKYGYVYAVSNEKYKSILGKQILTSDLKELRLKRFIEKKGNYGNLFSVPVHTIEIPIDQGNGFKGTIIMHTSLENIKYALKNVYKIIWASAILAIVVSCIVIYYFSQKIIIKPLAQINCVARKISKGEVDKRVDIKSNDEIGELANSFNIMADSLEKVENNRRLFISNVSHEIRSPITSIKGFIGGMLDGIIPEDKKNYYLSIAYEEIGRLTRLVNDLLDLSAIESGRFSLKVRELNLNEIIRLAVIKFETRIRNKGLKVDVCFEQEELYVLSDRDRTIQIITNIIDNALKYVNEGGQIKITTKSKGKKAYISVFNSGPNINDEDLNHIWDRFYKADKARSSKISTGLGLSIVRSILSQLGEDIWVKNKENGVEFTFTLTKN